jgi:hypothetical protein
MAAMEPDLMDEYEGLMQFLYIAPIGLAQAKADGEVLTSTRCAPTC